MTKRHSYHGFVLGKFMPLHAGHEHLLQVANKLSERLTILVCSLPADPIPGDLRVVWVRERFPEANVVHLRDVIPQEPREHPAFWQIWRETIRRLVPESIDTVFASEEYGWQLASELGASFVPVDPARAMVPVSGTAIRNDPFRNWQYLSAPLRAHYAKRVAIVGPESVGKSTLTERLARQFDTVGVEEYARQYFDECVKAGVRQPGEFRYEDLTLIARAQPALEESLARRANRLIITDTDSLTTLTWSEYLYGRHEVWHEELVREAHYDLTLLLPPEGTDFADDGQRIMHEQSMREAFTERLKGNLIRFKRSQLTLAGSHDERFGQAVQAVEELFQ